MKIRLFLSIIVSFCLLSCGQKELDIERPPHSGEEQLPEEDNGNDQGEGEQPEDPSQKEPEGGPGTKGWTTTEISEGMNLHSFTGSDTPTKAQQRVFVLETDLNNSRYRIGFSCQPGANGRATTSEAQINSGAVAAVNATYERGSVFIKVDGSTISNIPNHQIKGSDGSVDNWKSEAGAFMNSDGKLYLEFSGKDKQFTKLRPYYRNHTCPNIFTSAPMLIDNYDPVGERFVPVSLTEAQFESQYLYEHPYRHQGVTHPRTAIALTKDNHLLLVVIDGRDGVIKGMSAEQVTKFLVYHFNPAYALNMDGGGSTAISINGKVYNKPSGGSERAVPTHFLVFDDKK